MGDSNFNQQQETAVSLRDRSLLVSASAGTGKTTVLVERIIRMATDSQNPIDLDRMLIVTFTNAASEEMKERIRRALYKEIKKNPSNDRLRRQLILLNQANISTIHSFCSEIIRSNYHLLDIDPGFAVCDENDADGYLRKAMSETLSLAYEEDSEAFVKLLDGYGRGKDDTKFAELLMDIYKKVRSMPAYRDWLVNAADLFTEIRDDFKDSIWGKLIMEYSASRVLGYIGDISDLTAMICEEETLSGYLDTMALDKMLLERVQAALISENWDSCSRLLAGLDFTKLQNAKKGAPDDLKQFVKGTRDEYKKEVDRIKERLKGSSEQIYENMQAMAPLMAKLAELLNGLDDEYLKIKREEGTLDYSDLEHFALECLESEAGEMYRDRFDEIFVDEYQDSNQLQEDIINLVSGRNAQKNNVFMVGDVKQSIYKFRQAEPEIFVKKRERYSMSIDDEEVKVELFENYRSRLPVLEFSNYIFSRIMSGTVGDIDYDDKVFLRMGKQDYPEGNNNGYPVEIKLVCGEDKVLFEKTETINIREAAVVGREIYRIIGSGLLVTDKKSGSERPVEFGDITILHRSVNSISNEFIRQLKKMGIPVYSESDSDFFKEREIIVMRSFLDVLDNPRRDIPLLALLRSSIFGFSDKELALIRCGSRRLSYYDSLISFNSEPKLKKKIDAFLDIISDYRKEADNRAMDRLVWSIMHETGFYNQCRPGDNALMRQQNLRRLFEIAGAYEGGRETGLFGFIRYLDNLMASGVNNGVGGGEGSSNTVRLMSIHKSKGLEFPVVILSGCGKSFNKMDMTKILIFDKEYGFGPDYINSTEGYKLITAMKKGIKIKKDIEGLAEEMRVLYVALTRAREKLIITGYVRNIETSLKKWQLRGRRKDGKIDAGKVMLASGFLDWIMSVAIKHRNSNKILTKNNENTDQLESGGPDFNVEIIPPDEIRMCMNLKKTTGTPDMQELGLDYDQIKSRFGWEYPYMAESLFHKKVSVTEIKKLREKQSGEKDIFGTVFVPRPDFMEDEGKSDAAERGTILHNVIAAVDVKRAFEPGYINNLFKTIGTPEEEINGYSEIITDFYRSNLGKRISSAAHVESEKPFLLPVPTRYLYPDNPILPDENHTTLVQGVIDCLFYENDGIVIVDYKSDNVEPGNEITHAKRYSLQLELYTRAIEALTGLTVKEKYIYFLKTRCEVRL